MRFPRSRRLDIVWGGLLPGALAGVHLAGLIFFLNPQIPFTPGTVARGALVYGGLLGAASLLLHLPFLWGRPQRARRWLPWGLTLALGGAAALDWTHASHYAYYLPTGINERLLKTALWLTLGALIAFYTALLHSLHRRRYGWRSRYAFVLLALLSVYAMLERREAFRPRPVATPRPLAVEAGQRPRLWVVGLETATLDAILPLAGQGRLPFLAGVLEQGAYGRLETFSPPWREPVWTTLATGKYPHKHGVKGLRSYPAGWLSPGAEIILVPVGVAFRKWGMPWTGPQRTGHPRQALTFWEILPRLEIPSGVLAWPASAPVRPGPVFGLSDRFFVEPRAPGSARPEDLAARAELFRVRPEEVAPPQRARFGPDPRPSLVEALAGDLWRQSISFFLLEQHPEVEATFVTLPGLREVSRRDFGGFAAVQFEGAQDEASRQAAERLAGYYAELDEYLAEVWSRLPEPKILAVVSAHGVEARRRRLAEAFGPRDPGGDFNGAPDGVLLLHGSAGAGIRPRALLTGARAVDLVPTLMYALGYPVARDLDGQVLTAAFDEGFLARHPLTFLPTYEGLAE